jgi:hypothetical protein
MKSSQFPSFLGEAEIPSKVFPISPLLNEVNVRETKA